MDKNRYTIKLLKLSHNIDDWQFQYDCRHKLISSGPKRPDMLYEIDSSTPLSARRAVFECAVYFRREFGYDFVQYGYEGKETDPKHVAFLWSLSEDVDRTSYAVGGCCFRWRSWKNHGPGYSLQWIWLHPYFRDRGLLQEAWPYFIARFGLFLCEGPYSRSMEAFLKKYGFRENWCYAEGWDEPEQDTKDDAPTSTEITLKGV